MGWIIGPKQREMVTHTLERRENYSYDKEKEIKRNGECQWVSTLILYCPDIITWD